MRTGNHLYLIDGAMKRKVRTTRYPYQGKLLKKLGIWDGKSKSSRSKYRNKKTEVDGIIFDSAKEARRYGELKMLEAAGRIEGLRLQVPFPIEINGKEICKYYADFVYKENGAPVVEDTKGVRTPLYRIKKKMVAAYYGIKIFET